VNFLTKRSVTVGIIFKIKPSLHAAANDMVPGTICIDYGFHQHALRKACQTKNETHNFIILPYVP
jgi:hypothetical protein